MRLVVVKCSDDDSALHPPAAGRAVTHTAVVTYSECQQCYGQHAHMLTCWTSCRRNNVLAIVLTAVRWSS